MKALALCGLLAAGLVVVGPARAEKYHCLCIAHRAGASLGPESTFATLANTARVPGVDGIEFDVHKTADGKLIVIHDPTVKRTTNGGDRKVSALTLAQLEALDAGSWWDDGRYAGQRLPRPAPFIDQILADGLSPVVELKVGGIEDPIAEMIRERHAVGRTWIIAFSYHVIEVFGKKYPEFRTTWLVDRNTFKDTTVAAVVESATAAGCKGLNSEYRQITPELVKACHDAGLLILAWTVDKPAEMERLIRLGVDGITTNRPQDLAKLLRQLNAGA